MCESMDGRDPGGRERLAHWFTGPLGRSLQALESHRLRDILPAFAGTFAVQVGHIGDCDLLESSPTAVHVLVDPDAGSGGAVVRALPEELPLDTRSVQVVLLAHTLDVSEQPHQALREAERVLAPEGHVVILGFNRVSLWRLACLFRHRRERRPWCGAAAIGLSRLKDWLSLLDFELVRGGMLYYRPPVAQAYLRDRLFFLERIGDRWWPLGAAVYLVVARKRTPGMMPIPRRARRRRLRPASRPVGLGHG
ncbi:MAG: methyltransferase domain-containing protein [Gammaproteobacteria bacterium]|nr:methyltransferase domain-containing protein [Gammaproteobacteria bacterium]